MLSVDDVRSDVQNILSDDKANSVFVSGKVFHTKIMFSHSQAPHRTQFFM